MNEALAVQIRNPFALREALLVAMEASWTDLSSDQVQALRDFTLGIPQTVKPGTFHVLRSEQQCLVALDGYFRHSRTRYWLREDLVTALTQLTDPLQKGAQT